jgi:hypothetical protein
LLSWTTVAAACARAPLDRRSVRFIGQRVPVRVHDVARILPRGGKFDSVALRPFTDLREGLAAHLDGPGN